MALTHVVTEVKNLSTFAKIGVAVAVILVLVLLIGGTVGLVHHFEQAAANEKEQKAVKQRQQDEEDKTKLKIEKAQQETRAAEAEAQRDAYKQVAESKRADRTIVVKELEQVERDHEKHKAEVEATGGTLPDDELRRELCARMAKRPGYKPCPER